MTMALSADALEYLDTCPLTADAEDIPEETFLAHMKASKTLPENIRRILVSPQTSAWIRATVTEKYQLSLDHAVSLAVLLREILFGEQGAASITKDIQHRLAVPQGTAELLAKDVTRKFIVPNYFQVSKLHDRFQQAQGTPHGYPAASAPTLSGRERPLAPPSIPPAGARLGNVVDLRSTPRPGETPPPPTVLPPLPPSLPRLPQPGTRATPDFPPSPPRP